MITSVTREPNGFIERYPLSASEILHFPLMFPESLRKFHVPGIRAATLEYLYDFTRFCGLADGTVRTALSRMKKEGTIVSEDADGVPRYRVADFQKEIMGNVIKRRKAKGFTVAVFSFEAEQERERSRTRELLRYAGFVRFAQNAYINVRRGDDCLRAELERAGVADHVFLFPVDRVDDRDLARLIDAWKVPERADFLKLFLRDVRELVEAVPAGSADSFHRVGLAWVAFIVHVFETELPLPESLLPPGYPYDEVYDYLNRASARNGRSMIRHYKEMTTHKKENL